MIRASSLYIVIIIALVISIICAVAIATAFSFNIQFQKKARWEKLQNNLQSGIAILLATGSRDSATLKIDIFNNQHDSLLLRKTPWGVFDIGLVKSFQDRDTLSSAFAIAARTDPSNFVAFYLADEDGALSFNGRSFINGNTYLPKAGLKKVFLDGKAYLGPDVPVSGHIWKSAKTLPGLNQERVDHLELNLTDTDKTFPQLNSKEINHPFSERPLIFNISADGSELSGVDLAGNIVLHCNSLLTIDSTCKLDGIVIYAKAIKIKSGFNGRLQMFVRDSLVTGNTCLFRYPSCIGLIKSKIKPNVSPPKLIIGKNSIINGVIFLSTTDTPHVPALIDLKSGVSVYGQVYTKDIILMNDHIKIHGSTYTGKIVYNRPPTIYENVLIDAEFDQYQVFAGYLSPDLIPGASQDHDILQWLDKP